MKPYPPIIIFGLSGSGKSTLANVIGNHFGLRVIHPSGVLRQLLKGQRVDPDHAPAGRGFWEHQAGVKLFKDHLKTDKPIDVVCDQIILKEARKGNIAIDSWSLPWIFNGGIRIHLKATLNERARRVAKRSRITRSSAKKIVSLKDEKTRQMFKRVYGFDIKKDHDVFDYVIRTDGLTLPEVKKDAIHFLEKQFKGRQFNTLKRSR